MTSRALQDAYLRAVYVATELRFQLSPVPTGESLFAGRRLAIITAYNPRSKQLSEAENAVRHLALTEAVKALGFEHVPSLSCSLEGSWQEPGLVIFDLSQETALELGRRFEQNAVLYGVTGRIAMLWCDDGRLECYYPRRLVEPGEMAKKEDANTKPA